MTCTLHHHQKIEIFFLNVMRIVAHPHQPIPATTPPINLQFYPTSRQQLQDAPITPDPSIQSSPTTSTIPTQSATGHRDQHLTPPAFMRPRSTLASESGTETETQIKRKNASGQNRISILKKQYTILNNTRMAIASFMSLPEAQTVPPYASDSSLDKIGQASNYVVQRSPFHGLSRYNHP